MVRVEKKQFWITLQLTLSMSGQPCPWTLCRATIVLCYFTRCATLRFNHPAKVRARRRRKLGKPFRSHTLCRRPPASARWPRFAGIRRRLTFVEHGCGWGTRVSHSTHYGLEYAVFNLLSVKGPLQGRNQYSGLPTLLCLCHGGSDQGV